MIRGPFFEKWTRGTSHRQGKTNARDNLRGYSGQFKKWLHGEKETGAQNMSPKEIKELYREGIESGRSERGGERWKIRGAFPHSRRAIIRTACRSR